MRSGSQLARAGIFFLLAVPLLGQSDWPRWRGPHGDGSVDAPPEPVAWLAEPERLWDTRVGSGYSGPVARGDSVWIHAREGEEELVHRLSLATGEVLWTQRYPATFRQHESAGGHGSGPYATPALIEDRLVTFGIQAILSVWNADDGTLIWRKDHAEEFEPSYPFFGAAGSPLAWGGLCFVHFGGQREEDYGKPGVGAMVALRLEDGSEAWRWTGDSAALGATPIVGGLGGRSLLVFKTRALLVGVDARSGQELWRLPFRVAEDNTISTPLVIGDHLITSDYEKGILAWRLSVEGDKVRPGTLWHTRSASLFMSSPVVVGDQLVGFSHLHKGLLFGLDPVDGAVLWRGEGRQGEHASLIVWGDQLLIWREDGTLVVAEVSRQGLEILHEYRLTEGRSWSHPALIDGRLLVRHGSRLSAWRISR